MKCPFCAGDILESAVRCHHCGVQLTDTAEDVPRPDLDDGPSGAGLKTMGLLLLAAGAVLGVGGYTGDAGGIAFLAFVCLGGGLAMYIAGRIRSAGAV